MNEEPMQTCGCDCEMCMAGNHDQCPTGMCTIKNAAAAPTEGSEEGDTDESK